MRDAYDGIILGAGHNGLVLQAYLSRAGFSTVCLEAREVAGGGLATVEYPAGSGFLHNTHSFYHRGLTEMPWFQELRLEQHGAKYVTPELNVALISSDGCVLEWWTDFDRTIDSIAHICRRDAETLRSWCERFRTIVRDILIPEATSPPLPPEARQARLRQSREGELLLRVSEVSPFDFVLREFEHPLVQAGLLFFNGLREVDLRCPGFGHHIPALLASGRMAQMCLGGSRRLAEALVAAIREHGGEVELGLRPQKIRVENGVATGVQLTNGEFLRARHFIASSLNPQQTFLELLDPDVLPTGWLGKAEQYKYNVVAPLFSLNLNMSEAPRYSASELHPELSKAFMVILGLDHPKQFLEMVRHHEAGTIPPPILWGSCPTLFDPSQAPANRHTAFMWEKLPYRLHGDPSNWDREKSAHGTALRKFWTQYAPNVEPDTLDEFCGSPLDVERTLPNMRFGDLLVGALSHGQVGFHRPFPGAGHYRTPLQRLYLCGSCCHPGGNITGLPGYNSAKVLLADLAG